MAENLLGQFLSQGHEHDGPDDGMEPDDLLTYQVNIGRPVFSKLFVIIG